MWALKGWEEGERKDRKEERERERERECGQEQRKAKVSQAC